MSAHPPPARPRHEGTDAQPRVVAAIAGALVLLIGGGLLAGLGYVRTRAPAGSPVIAGLPAGPEERPSVARDWAAYQRDIQAHLSGYGWIDRRAGLVRIPLDRAIDLECAAEEAARAAGGKGATLP